MANNLELKAVITAEDKASQTISGFGKTSVAAFGAIAGIAQSVTTKAIDAVTASVGDAVKRVDTLNNAGRVFANMGYSAGDVKGAMDGLNKSILGLPTSLDQAVSGMQMIASTTGDIGRAQGIFSALNDAVIGFGGSAADVQGAVLQLSQAFSNGRIDAQTWNSLMQNNLGPTLNAIAKDMGITTGQLKQGLSDGSISVQQFQDELIKLDKNGGGGLKSLQNIAHDATAGIATGMENAKTAMTRGIADIIKAIGPENLSGAITALGSAIETLFKSIANLVTFMQQNPVLTAAVLGALGGVILAVVVPAFIAWAAAAGAAAIATIAATWPILAIGAAIGVVAYLVVTHWKTITDAFTVAINWIADKATYLKDHFWEVVGFIIGFFATLPIKIPIYVYQALAAIINFLLSINWSAVLAGIGHAFVAVWEWVKSSALGAFNYIKNLNWGSIFSGIGRGIGNNIIGMIEGAVNGALKGIPGSPHINLPRFAGGVENFAGGLAIVGERGPEIVSLPRGSSVIPNNQIGSGGVTNVNVTFTGPMMGNASEAREFARNIANALNDLAGSKNQSVMEYLA